MSNSATFAAAGKTCSKLSSTSSRCWSRKCSLQCFESRFAARFYYTQCVGDGRSHQFRLGDRSELDEEDTVGKFRQHIPRDRQRQRRLTCTADTCQCQKSQLRLPQAVFDLTDFL